MGSNIRARRLRKVRGEDDECLLHAIEALCLCHCGCLWRRRIRVSSHLWRAKIAGALQRQHTFEVRCDSIALGQWTSEAETLSQCCDNRSVIVRHLAGRPKYAPRLHIW